MHIKKGLTGSSCTYLLSLDNLDGLGFQDLQALLHISAPLLRYSNTKRGVHGAGAGIEADRALTREIVYSVSGS